MKSVLISIQPKWCELIASGKKTVEVRKTKPKLETPFKVYIYCTQGDALALPHLNNPHYAIHRMNNGTLNGRQMTAEEREQSDHSFANGKVIGEFVCDTIHNIKIEEDFETGASSWECGYYAEEDCLSMEEFEAYLKKGFGYGWHISDLVIYKKPRELSEFKKPCICKGEYEGEEYCDCLNCDLAGDSDYGIIACDRKITRPPQSWCYVERREQNEG